MTRLALMARAPVAGQTKTRLIPHLGAEGAAALAQRLLVHAVAQAVQAVQATHLGLGEVTVWATPNTDHPVFVDAQLRYGVKLAVQDPSADLGARMAHVFSTSFGQGPSPVLLMGSDIPALTAPVLRQAALALRTHDAVFVPALDGGYALVGLRAPAPSLFNSMVWSTDQVMAQTRARLQAAGLTHHELPALPDIDNPADLVHLPAGWA
jgi:uncharacterized protein